MATPLIMSAHNLDGQVQHLLDQFDQSSILNNDRDQRLVIAIAGVPGSGKSTIASNLVRAINSYSKTDCAIALPLDGFHYPKAVLDTFRDPTIAHARRGAQFTFDARGYLDSMRDLLQLSSSLTWPGFDHSIGDPVPDEYEITCSHTIAVVEGLYTIVNRNQPPAQEGSNLSHHMVHPEWFVATSLVHERWWVRVPTDTARHRLACRHVQSNLALNLPDAYCRIDQNDAINALWVEQHVDMSSLDCVIDNT